MAGIESLEGAGMLMLVAAELDSDIHLCPRNICVYVHVYTGLHVHLCDSVCSFSCVCMNIIAS